MREAIRCNQMQSDRTIRMTSRHLPEQVEQEGGIVRRLERVDIQVGQPALHTARTRGTPRVGEIRGDSRRFEEIRGDSGRFDEIRAEAKSQHREHKASTKRAHGSRNGSRHRRGLHVRASGVGGGLGGGGHMWRARNTIDDQVKRRRDGRAFDDAGAVTGGDSLKHALAERRLVHLSAA
jgi:hypothetical protein